MLQHETQTATPGSCCAIHFPIFPRTEGGGVEEEAREPGAGHGDEHVEGENPDDEGPAPGTDLELEFDPGGVDLCCCCVFVVVVV